MKIKTHYLTSLLLLVAIFSFSSCGKDDEPSTDDNTTNNGDRTGSVDEYYIGNWLSENAALPQLYKDNYSKFELELANDGTYSWKWYKKDGNVTDYTGYITTTKHDQMHTTGYNLYSISINVTAINGNPSPGGWVGLYSYDNEGKTLILNAEPNVSGVTAPTLQGGIGSGSSGADAVFTFTYQN